MSATEHWITCPHCYSESNKALAIEQMQAQAQKEGSEGEALLLAQCSGCHGGLLVTVHANGEIDIIAPGQEGPRQSKDRGTGDAPALPDAETEDQAYKHYEDGLRQYQDGDCLNALASWSAAYRWYSVQGNDEPFRGGLLSNIGMAHDAIGDHQEAIRCFQSALGVFDKDHDHEEYGTILGNIGGAYLHLGDMGLAEEYHRKAYDLRLEKEGAPELLARERSNLAFVYDTMAALSFSANQVDQSLDRMKQAVTVMDGAEETDELPLYLLKLGNLARHKARRQHERGALDNALENYELSLRLHLKAEADDVLLLDDNTSLAEVYRAVGKTHEAVSALQQCEEITERLRQRQPLQVALLEKRGRSLDKLRSGISSLAGRVLSRHSRPRKEDE